MIIYALNGMQEHSESVRKNVSLVGHVTLRGYYNEQDIQLLEGSHRMAYGIELGVPVEIVIFAKDEIIPHDCDDIESVTGLWDRAMAGELASALLKERGLYGQAVYDSDKHTNIKIIHPNNRIGETGEMVYGRLTEASPFSAFPEKVWVVAFGELKDVIGKHILVLGDEKAASAYKKLGAEVIFCAASAYQEIDFYKLSGEGFDHIYCAGIAIHKAHLSDLYAKYKGLLKAGGLAVTIGAGQNSELIREAGWQTFWFLDTLGEAGEISFLKG